MNYSLSNVKWPLQQGEKCVLIVRHAKSSWDTGVSSDFARPLNERGLRDAPDMGKRLLAKGIVPQMFLSSPAKRAKQTAELIAGALQYPTEAIVWIPELYHAPSPVFFDAISRLDNAIDSVAIFSHNPGITDFVNQLTTAQIDDMPTCGIFAIKTTISRWADFATAPKELLFFDYPKSEF
jgi:phosphohistidine phosphatase